MSILLLFNNSSAVTYQQLMSATQMTDLDIKCNIIPLLQMKILLKGNPSNPQANPKEFYPSDIYTLNPGFKH